MIKKLLYLCILISCALQIAPAYSKPPYACPKRIALIEGNDLAQNARSIIQKIYKALDCETVFIELPGKRGIVEFNRGKVDGELVRLDIVEKLYTVPFIRSSHPLFTLPHSLWVHPSASIHATAYLLGVIWQRNYMKGKENGISFPSYSAMFEAYNQGKVTAFLANDISVQAWLDENQLKPVPHIKETMSQAPIFHYLSPEFKEFAAVFSDYVAHHKPFEKFK